ncbi:pyridoxal phosphate-dependent transferase [Rhodotorula diobovata]|uniref:Pyridoxal phosphate-dependent transferase n=1 Tax=Rhodotorula diobovata TaxID=5288 RepID=A0A5C5FZP6_9BASI|nr:pyridoxal phosphate-dependent transferase [Rhodotorula diobovata]
MALTDVHSADSASYDQETFAAQLERINGHVLDRARSLPDLPVTSTKDAIEHALEVLPDGLPAEGLGLEATTTHLLSTISPALSPGQAGPRCFALITGGVTPAAQLADMLVTSYDPCVQVHWPEQTISVALEALTLSYLLSLRDLSPMVFTHNTLTTGATASNLLGLCVGRDWTVARVKQAQGHEGWSVPEDGMGGVEVDVLIVDAHASVRKAAALAGLGRRSVVQVGDAEAEKEGRLVSMDLRRLEERLRDNVVKGRGSIVVTSFGEVNTGAINSDTPAIRGLCDKYHAWLHIDAAFAAFAVLHPDFAPYQPHLALADSITSDAHKWLNVPYDCGIFLSRARTVVGPNASDSTITASLYDLCGPGDAAPAYLATPAASTVSAGSTHPRVESTKALRSPLFLNIENSRRFRALPLYASLLSLGKAGYARLVARNVAFARRVEAFLRSHPGYDVLTPSPSPASIADDPFAFRTLNIVLFAPSSLAPERYRLASASSPDPAAAFLQAINASNEVFCTGTTWRGRKAVRLAVSNWGTELEEGREWEVVRRVLERVMHE